MIPVDKLFKFDLMNLDELLTPAQKATVRRTRNWIDQQLSPIVQQSYQNEQFPKHLIKVMGTEKFLGAHLKGEGLPGYDPIEYGLMMREFERCDSGFRSFLSVHSALAMYAIYRYGSPDQKSYWLPPMANGEKVGCFALTEPDGGSDPASMKTSLIKVGQGWKLNGHKRWVTNAPFADLVVVWAKVSDRIRGLIVPLKQTDIEVRPIKNKLSLRVSASAEIYFNDVSISDENFLPDTKSLGSALDCLNQARYGIIWGVLGAAEACLEITLDYVKQRQLFGRPLSSFQLTQQKLANCYRDLTLAQIYALRLGQIANMGQLKPAQISLGKFNNVEVALRIARTCRELLGANGILLENDVMRHLCNLETVFTYEGTHDIHQLVLGQELTGNSAFS